MTNDRKLSSELQPGTKVRYEDGTIVTLDRRKTLDESDFRLPGWWVVEGGGLADLVIDDRDSRWTVLENSARASQEDETP